MEKILCSKKKTIIFISIFLVIMILIGCLIYKKVISVDEEEIHQEETQQDESLENEYLEIDNNTDIVQNIYKLFKYDIEDYCNTSIYDFLELIKSNKVVVMTDISHDLKNYFAIQLISNDNIGSINCSDLILDEYGQIEPGIICGDDDTVTISETTNFIDENLLKEKVEQLFGVGTYEKSNLILNSAIDVWVYDDASEARYIKANVQRGCPNYGTQVPVIYTKIVSAKESLSELIVSMNYVYKIEEEIKETLTEEELKYYEQNEYNFNVQYKFKLENTYYIFESAEIVE